MVGYGHDVGISYKTDVPDENKLGSLVDSDGLLCHFHDSMRSYFDVGS
jgi:hypothetical protein